MNNKIAPSGEILLYQNGGDKEFVSVVFKNENFWLTQKAMAELFDCTPENIIQHFKNIYAEEERSIEATAKKFLGQHRAIRQKRFARNFATAHKGHVISVRRRSRGRLSREKGAETQGYFVYFGMAVSGFAAYRHCIPLAGTSFRNEFMTQKGRKAPQMTLCGVALIVRQEGRKGDYISKFGRETKKYRRKSK